MARVGLWSFLTGAASSMAGRSSAEFSSPAVVDAVIRANGGLESDVFASSVTRDFALSVPAVLRGRNILCSIATLPLQHFRTGSNEAVRSGLLEQIDPQTPNVVTLAQTVEDLIFDGIAWWQITAYGWDGFPASAQHVDLSRVSLDPPPGAPRTLPSGVDRSSVVWLDGKPVSGSDMIRFDSPNPPLLKAGRRAIRRAALLDAAAARYAEDPRPLDYFAPAEDSDPEDDEVQAILDDWIDARRRRSTAYVPGSLMYKTVDSPSPADLQLAQLQARASLDLANALGLDPEDLGVSTTSRTYSNVTDRRRDRINDTLSPFMLAITSRLSMNDVTRRGYGVRFDLTDYLKADPMTQANVAAVYLDRGVWTREEARAAQGMPVAVPVAGAPQDPQQQNQPPAASAAASASGGALTGPVQSGPGLEPAHAVTFSAPSQQARSERFEARQTFALAAFEGEIDAQFKVDEHARTVTGLAVPFGVVGDNGWARWRFHDGSVKWTDPSRVKLLVNHDYAQAIGKAIKLTSTPEGVVGTFKVARGAEGDRVLGLAADGVLDGMSIGVDLNADGFHPNPDDPGLFEVFSAALRETSLTPVPAFDDARVSDVAASRQAPAPFDASRKDAPMTQVADNGTTQAAAESAPVQPAPAGAQFDAAAFSTLIDAKLAQFAAPAPEVLAAAVASAVSAELAAAPVREQVSPHRPGAAFVREPLPYRFDGLRREHDFSTDLFAAARHSDGAAQERLDKFMKAVFADVSTGDVNELNPDRQRPDLFVDQKEYMTPMWDAINKGSLMDATPFTLPKFNTASGLVGDHTESTEPTAGTYTTTGQTITPGAVSGKVEITREVMDQGGNPQVSGIIWAAIMRAWFEALEAKAAAVLTAGAASITDIALTTAAADDDLVNEVTAAFAALQYTRGGFRMRDFFVQVDLYTRLVNAIDSTGRPLLPVLGAQNTSGSADPLFGAVAIGGTVARPAWALAATSGNSANSWLLDRGDVHGWASTPQRLQFEYQVKSVEVGVWGYQATAITDYTGVRQVTYDPTA